MHYQACHIDLINMSLDPERWKTISQDFNGFHTNHPLPKLCLMRITRRFSLTWQSVTVSKSSWPSNRRGFQLVGSYNISNMQKARSPFAKETLIWHARSVGIIFEVILQPAQQNDFQRIVLGPKMMWWWVLPVPVHLLGFLLRVQLPSLKLTLI